MQGSRAKHGKDTDGKDVQKTEEPEEGTTDKLDKAIPTVRDEQVNYYDNHTEIKQNTRQNYCYAKGRS